MKILNAQETINAIRSLGITLVLRNGQLRARPRRAVPPELVALVDRYRDEITDILAVEPPVADEHQPDKDKTAALADAPSSANARTEPLASPAPTSLPADAIKAALEAIKEAFPGARLIKPPAPSKLQWAPDEHVRRLFDPDRLFKTGFDFYQCQVCGTPADLVIPRDVAKDGPRRLCGDCFRKVAPSLKGKRREKQQARACPLCRGKWLSADELPEPSNTSICTTRNFRDIENCIKFRFLRHKLDADELTRPPVKHGLFSPWPQSFKRPTGDSNGK